MGTQIWVKTLQPGLRPGQGPGCRGKGEEPGGQLVPNTTWREASLKGWADLSPSFPDMGPGLCI